MKVLHQEKRWLGHVNASPTQPHLLSFCQEGPWEKVEHRIWVMNTKSHERWKIREGHPRQFAGHEYWHEDGIHIGYHGFTESLERQEASFSVIGNTTIRQVKNLLFRIRICTFIQTDHG